jgi:hypothetical protein
MIALWLEIRRWFGWGYSPQILRVAWRSFLLVVLIFVFAVFFLPKSVLGT